MSKDDVRKIVGRLMSDEQFVELFKSNPRKALSGFNLTPTERNALSKLNPDAIAATDINLGRDLDLNATRVGALYVA